MKKILLALLLLVSLLAVPSVSAFREDTYCSPNNECVFSFEIRDRCNKETSFNENICKFHLFNDTGEPVFTDNMTNTSSGFHHYKLNPAEEGLAEGKYKWRVICAKNANFVGAKSGSVQIRTSVTAYLENMEGKTPIGIALAILAFLFAYLGLRLDNQHSPLKWLFILFSITTGVVSVFIMGLLAKDKGITDVAGVINDGFLYGVLVVLIFAILYFLILFLTRTLSKLGNETYGEKNR